MRSLSRCRRFATLCLVAISLSLFSLDRAEGHPNHGTTLGERYLKLDFGQDRVRVVYGLTFTSQTSREALSPYDLDGDRHISESEGASIERSFRVQIRDGVSFTNDDSPQPIEWNPPFTTTITGPILRRPFAFEVTGVVKASPGEHRISLIDGVEFSGIYRTAAKIVATKGVKILRSDRGKNPRDLVTDIIFIDPPREGAPSKRQLTAQVVFPGEAPQERGLLLWATIALIAVAGMILLLGRHRYWTGKG